MNQKTVFVILSWLSASALLLGQAQAQGSAVALPPCAAPAQPAAQAGGGRGPAPQRIPRDVTIMAIRGVVAAGAQWAKVWQAGGNSADGILADKDGSALVAQEDYDAVLRIDKNDKASVYVSNANGVGSLSMDRQGRLYGVHRTERPGSTKPDQASIVNAITILAPGRKMVADKWADGTTLSVRPNDLAADSQGGAYFTSGCVYYASATGTVTIVAENIRTNGVVFSADDKILYVTNGGGQTPGTIVAFDVKGPGMLANRRDFATLEMGNGDGSAVDSEGRLYVTSNPGVQVFDKTGKYLGLIPTPRGVISVGFAGPVKKTLYVVGSGAEDTNGQPIREGPQQTAATIYKLPMIAVGVKGRAK
ncbi:MAG TPA: SMP-30/gluconolactonase/LRE family protein [Terriglobia bacterium]|nr:SMP-30/gluconolactonase/LRE family protein [Terriglobia bacterium]